MGRSGNAFPRLHYFGAAKEKATAIAPMAGRGKPPNLYDEEKVARVPRLPPKVPRPGLKIAGKAPRYLKHWVPPIIGAPVMALMAPLLGAKAPATLKTSVAESMAWLREMSKRQPGWIDDSQYDAVAIFEYENLLYISFDEDTQENELKNIPEFKNVAAAVQKADPARIKGPSPQFARKPLKTIQNIFTKGKLNEGKESQPLGFASVLLYKDTATDTYAVLAASQCIRKNNDVVYIDYVGNVMAANPPNNKALQAFSQIRQKELWPSPCTIMVYLNFVLFLEHAYNRVYLLNAAHIGGCLCYYTAAEAANYRGYILKLGEEHPEDFQVLETGNPGRRSGRKMSDFIRWDKDDPDSCGNADRFFHERAKIPQDEYYYAYFIHDLPA